MTSTATIFEGRWRTLANLSADRTGSIHDDEAARRLGFRGGFVPGSTVATAGLPAVSAALGESWLQGGWYTFKFVRPVYVTDEVRETATAADGGAIEVRIETRDGRLCCVGSAGLGVELPWDPQADGQRGADEVLPDLTIGGHQHNEIVDPAPEDAARLLDAAGATGFGQTSAGDPALPPERLMNAALNVVRGAFGRLEGLRQPGMWAEHSLLSRRAIGLDEPLRVREWLADKGVSGRSAFVTWEFTVHDPASDEELARGRHQVKWLREDAPLEAE